MTTSATKTGFFSSRFELSTFKRFYPPSQIGEESKAASLGIVDLPALVYFESNVPHLYKGDLRLVTDEQEYNDTKWISGQKIVSCESHFLVVRVERDVLDWLLEQLTTDEIEEVRLKHQTSPT